MIATVTPRPFVPLLGVEWSWGGVDVETSIYHKPVLLQEVIQALELRAGGRYIDCTTGEGGHAQAIAQAADPDGFVLALDLDPHVLERARQRLQPLHHNITFTQASYARLQSVTSTLGIHSVDGILFDLGLSSFQLEGSGRGFSFRQDEPLDMRFDPSQPLTAAQVVNTYNVTQLADIFHHYGEERRARSIARAIVENRPVTTTGQLARLAAKVVGRPWSKIHPATRTFQALRIQVNQELENLKSGLQQALDLLTPGGRLVVISYHSLEDRIVKQMFRRESQGCLCPPSLPTCICGHEPKLKVLTRKIITPTEGEVRANPRSRSARMRVGQRLLD